MGSIKKEKFDLQQKKLFNKNEVSTDLKFTKYTLDTYINSSTGYLK